MNAEIISVGTELLLGNIVNTDARDLSIALSELGINVYWQTVVGDNPERLRAALAVARSRAGLIITTGGLGPTCDDLTKQTVAETFGAQLYFDERAARELRAFFRVDDGGTMPENNLQQCYLPVGCTPFYNTCGTAPGCGFTAADGTVVMLLPGPPKELNAMLQNGGLAFLRTVSGAPIFSHNIMTFGMGESAIESRLRDEMNALTNPTLAPYAREGDVRLRVTAKAETQAEADARMAPVIALVREKLGGIIYGIDTPSLEATVLSLLLERGETFAAAESCTGGLIAKRMTDLPGASAVFRGGVTVYTNDAKMRLLGVDEETLRTQTAVSRAVAVQLAERVREKLDADYGIGVTGVAGPDTDGVHPVGTVFVSLSSRAGTAVRALTLSSRSDRSRIRTLSANHAFDMLRRGILGLPLELAEV
ncbi:MAG: competence/damage-inducible protein A [Oscillospiraceae bacterium]|nr:competence/damage-inducible protein A [Oscillospiraceae bacterium]